MDFHWASFLLGIGATLATIVGVVLLDDHLKRWRRQRHDQAIEARRALAWDVLGRLGDAPLHTLDVEEGYLDAAIDANNSFLSLAEAGAKERSDRHAPTVSANLRLAFQDAVVAAVAASPRRLQIARRGLRDGRLLFSLYLPVGGTAERHSVWVGRIDGNEGRRAVFGDHPDDR